MTRTNAQSLFSRSSQNVAQPLALFSDGFSPNLICQNLTRVIRHLTGASVQDVVQQLGEAEAVGRKDQLERGQPMKKLKQSLLSGLETSILKFGLVDDLPHDDVVDYALVHGNDVSDLTVQTLVRVSTSKAENNLTIKKLLDVAAEFCRLSSASELASVPFISGEIS